jgi:hypothetical protein
MILLETNTLYFISSYIANSPERVSLSLFDLGYLQHEKMGDSKCMLYIEPYLPPQPGTILLTSQMNSTDLKIYEVFCNEVLSQLETTGEVETNLGIFKLIKNTLETARPIGEGINKLWLNKSVLFSCHPEFAEACQSRFMERMANYASRF